MRVLLIAYTLRNDFKDYSSFFEAIKGNCSQWWHFIDSIFIVYTHHSANEYAHFLYPHMENDDSLFVTRLKHEEQGWLVKEAWDWLNEKQF
jgi:hypothetical protein